MSFRIAVFLAFISCLPVAAGAQSHQHEMFSKVLGDGWHLAGMAQARPTFNKTWSQKGTTHFDVASTHLTHTAVMLNLESTSRRLVLRLTTNFEGLTQRDGEVTLGSWGNGFIDSRHPHHLLHEAMASFNVFSSNGGGLSLSAGQGFAPYGTDDPMGRPSAKYPTNHHLSQIPERFTLNAAWSKGAWILEAGVFGGSHSESPYDLSHIKSFGDSWSTRVSRRFGETAMGDGLWEFSLSHARVSHTASHKSALFNGALRYNGRVANDQRLSGLMEYSWSDPSENHMRGYWSFLTEAQWSTGKHNPYARFETSIRPEFQRGDGISSSFFRYGHHKMANGATAWSILSLGYGFASGIGPVSIRPFVEGQIISVANERGNLIPRDLLGADSFTGVTVGMRLYFGGNPMRMGRYGILDPMTQMGRMQSMSGM